MTDYPHGKFAKVYARCRSLVRQEEYLVAAVTSAQQALDHELVASWIQDVEREWRKAGIYRFSKRSLHPSVSPSAWHRTQTAYDPPRYA